jgi:two-component system, sensor histidine kinase
VLRWVNRMAKHETAIVKRFIELSIKHSRTGSVLALLISTVLGLIIVPTAGWSKFLAWLLLVSMGFIGRGFYFDWIYKKYGASRNTLNQICFIAAVTGWVAFTCMPVFGNTMSIETLGVLTAIMVGWVAAAVTVLAVQPKIYLCYIVVCFGTVFSSWYGHVQSDNTITIAVALTLAGLMLQRVAQLIHFLLQDSVKIGVDKDELVAQLEEALDVAQKAQNTRSNFLAAASHDLLQPVHSLKLLINVLGKTTDEDRRRLVVRQIDHSAKSIDGMFRGLLDLAQIDAGTLRAKLQSIPLSYVLESSYAGYQDRCNEKGLTWKMGYDTDFEVFSDPVLLGRIARNLAENAFKFTEHGIISVIARDTGDYIELLTEDSGVGIVAPEQERVFEPFFRGQSAANTGADGIGLGLSTSRYMAEMLGIELKIVSSSDSGTTVSLLIPKAKLSAALTKQETEWIDLGQKFVVIVDDDKLVLSATQLWFEACGAQTVAVANWPALLKKLEEAPRKPDLIIADFRLHGSINGVEVIAKICSQFGYIPAIVISGESHSYLEESGLPFVQKPIQFSILISKIKALNI